MSVEQLYDQVVRELPKDEQLRLVYWVRVSFN